MAIGPHHVFVGTWGGGVLRAPRDEPPFRLLTQLGAGGLRNMNITAVMANGEVGRPWVGSFGGGPQRVDVTAGKSIDPIVGPADDPITVAGVVSLAQLPGGRLFAGATEGLFGFDADGRDVASWNGTTAGTQRNHRPGLRRRIAPSRKRWPVGGRRRQRPAPARRRRTLSRVPP